MTFLQFTFTFTDWCLSITNILNEISILSLMRDRYRRYQVMTILHQIQSILVLDTNTA